MLEKKSLKPADTGRPDEAAAEAARLAASGDTAGADIGGEETVIGGAEAGDVTIAGAVDELTGGVEDGEGPVTPGTPITVATAGIGAPAASAALIAAWPAGGM
jgi:hypothetical protein